MIGIDGSGGPHRKAALFVILFGLLLCLYVQGALVPEHVSAADPPDQPGSIVIVLRQHSEVSGKEVLLGDVAEITAPDPGSAENLGRLVLGSAPLPGYSRTIHVFNIKTRLRQAGVHPSLVLFESDGDQIEVSRLPEAPVYAGSRGQVSIADGPTPSDGAIMPEAAIARGDQVTIEARIGSVTVTAKGIAKRDGVRGETIPVQNTQSNKIIYGSVIDSTTVSALP